MTTERHNKFIAEHLNDDVRQLLLHGKQYPDVDIAFCCQQIEGYQRARHKLPTLSKIDGWLFPPTLSLEQCSSEVTAEIKKHILRKHCVRITHLFDLTGGYGIDTYYLSQVAEHTTYIERQQALADIAAHNFALLGANIDVVSCDSTEWLKVQCSKFKVTVQSSKCKVQSSKSSVLCRDALQSVSQVQTPQSTVIYIDPARRSKTGSKVFRIEDLEPNILELLPLLLEHAKTIMVKLSPMLDLRQATEAILDTSSKFKVLTIGRAVQGSNSKDLNPQSPVLSELRFCVVSVKNEVKELLCLIKAADDDSSGRDTCECVSPQQTRVTYTAVMQPPHHRDTYTCVSTTCEYISDDLYIDTFSLLPEEEQSATVTFAQGLQDYIYEPDVAVMKLGAFKTIAEKYRLEKLDPNSHLYTSEHYAHDFPGRIFRFVALADKKRLTGQHLNIISRNYPLSADEIRRKYKILEGDKDYLIATRLRGKTMLALAEIILPS